MSNLKLSDKQRWAELLITKEGYTQKEAADTVGVTTVTMNKWFKKFGWERLRQSLLITRQETLSRWYAQLDEMNTAILNRPEGERYASSKEADSMSKLATAIERLETEANITDIYQVGRRLLDYMRQYNHPDTLLVASVFNDFIKHNLKR